MTIRVAPGRRQWRRTARRGRRRRHTIGWIFPEGPWLSLAVALGCGLLIGIERERRKAAQAPGAPAGLRSFTIASLIGALAQWLAQPWLSAAAALLLAALVAAAYWQDRARDPGMTTELALFVTFLIGAAAVVAPGFAAAAAVVVASLLAARTRLHRFATHVLTARELHDGLVLGAAALVVLPVVPDAPLPWLADLNPRRIWGLVVVLLALQALGHLAVRTIGERWGTPVAGVAAGFVSSMAVFAAMGGRVRAEPERLARCASFALYSNVATGLQWFVLASALHPPTALLLAWPMGAAVATAALAAAIAQFGATTDAAERTGARAFSLGQSVGIALMLSAATAGIAWITRAGGEAGLGVGALLAGLADFHAAALAILELAVRGEVAPPALLHATLLAFTANSAMKLAAGAVTGGLAFARRVVPGVAATVAAAWVAQALAG